MTQPSWKQVIVSAAGLSLLLLLLKNLALFGGVILEQQALLARLGVGWVGLPLLVALPLAVRVRRSWARWTLTLMCVWLGSSWLATWLTRELSSGFPLGRSWLVGVVVVGAVGAVVLLLLDRERNNDQVRQASSGGDPRWN